MTASRAIAIIIGRAGSKGLPGKNARQVAGVPIVAHTIAHARSAVKVASVVVSTDSPDIVTAAQRLNCPVVHRPAHLAGDGASVQDAVAHAVRATSEPYDIIVTLYANVPCRPDGLIDRAIDLLERTNADSVQSYAPVGKHHPSWMVELDRDGRVTMLDPKPIHRRQDLIPRLIPDGGVIVSRRSNLPEAPTDNPHAFLGERRYGIITAEGDVVDIDSETDLLAAEAGIVLQRRRKQKAFAIDGRRISRDDAPYVIAEIGVNHDGECNRLLDLVDAAADAGADAVKTQFFRSDLLMGRSAALAEYQRRSGATDVHDMIRALEVSRTMLEAFVTRARARRVAPILTIFSTDLVTEVADLDFAAWKVASPDIIHLPLLSMLADTGKPMIISTGCAWPEEIFRAHAHLHVRHGVSCTFLHCVSAYPTPLSSAALAGISAVAAITGEPAGYSDHTTSCTTGALAVAAGASILEKHLTWSRAAAGPDHEASLEPGAFAAYVEHARAAHAALGRAGKGVLNIEEEVRTISRQSVTARRAMRAGHRLDAEDLMICRPGSGLTPDRLVEIVGRSLASDVQAGTPLTENDLA